MIDIFCKECYSNDSRITPLAKPKDCLKNHRQYVCSTCGRCICCSVDEKGRYRAMFPFKSLEIAILYLRTAEVITKKACGIYEIESLNGRKSYKIFSSTSELEKYLNKNINKRCVQTKPLFTTKDYKDYNEKQLRFLTGDEVERYLNEKNSKSRTHNT